MPSMKMEMHHITSMTMIAWTFIIHMMMTLCEELMGWDFIVNIRKKNRTQMMNGMKKRKRAMEKNRIHSLVGGMTFGIAPKEKKRLFVPALPFIEEIILRVTNCILLPVDIHGCLGRRFTRDGGRTESSSRKKMYSYPNFWELVTFGMHSCWNGLLVEMKTSGRTKKKRKINGMMLFSKLCNSWKRNQEHSALPKTMRYGLVDGVIIRPTSIPIWALLNT
mmetsp:Transcript_9233/g.15283  ORF Transcript_9233/g.15283 Transcript_9233/m.15283 type:complete len:220 (+) Transcript_9233:873-1532(+)